MTSSAFDKIDLVCVRDLNPELQRKLDRSHLPISIPEIIHMIPLDKDKWKIEPNNTYSYNIKPDSNEYIYKIIGIYSITLDIQKTIAVDIERRYNNIKIIAATNFEGYVEVVKINVEADNKIMIPIDQWVQIGDNEYSYKTTLLREDEAAMNVTGVYKYDDLDPNKSILLLVDCIIEANTIEVNSIVPFNGYIDLIKVIKYSIGNELPIVDYTKPGAMLSADKIKLDGIETGANNYVHPTSHPASIIIEDSNKRFVSDTEKSTWDNKASTNIATTTTNGLMAAADKVKLNSLSVPANVTTTTNGLMLATDKVKLDAYPVFSVLDVTNKVKIDGNTIYLDSGDSKLKIDLEKCGLYHKPGVSSLIGNNLELDLSTGQVFTHTAIRDITIIFKNPPVDRDYTILLKLTNGGNFIVSHGDSKFSKSAPILTSAGLDWIFYNINNKVSPIQIVGNALKDVK